MNKSKLLTLSIIPICFILGLVILGSLAPNLLSNWLSNLRYYTGDVFSSWYLLVGLGFIVISVYLLRHYGNVQLGNSGKLKTITYGGLIFTSVFAADIVFYSFHEWIYYYTSSFYGTMNSPLELATTYPLFHWGLIPWSFYIVPAIAYAYLMYRKLHQSQKLSDALPDKLPNWIKKLADSLGVIGLLLATSTTFSVTTPLMTLLLSSVLGLPVSTSLTVAILLGISIIYCIATLFDIKGISKVSTLCVATFLGIILLFLFTSNTQFIVESGLSGIGNLIQNFVPMSIRTDSVRLLQSEYTSGFSQSWTVFYWSYWISWCIATPFFIAKISKGRSIKEVILQGYGSGLLGTFLSFIVLGNSSIYTVLSSHQELIPKLLQDPVTGIVTIIDIHFGQYSSIVMILIFILMVLFYTSTFDSLTYVIVQYTSPYHTISEKVRRVSTIIWSLVFISLPIMLIKQQMVLSILQSLSIIIALPISIILILIIYNLLKLLKKENLQ